MPDFYVTSKGKRIQLPPECEHDLDARAAFIAKAEGAKATKTDPEEK